MNYVAKKLDVFDKVEANGKYQTALLHERGTALISAAVTGKMDVPDWQHPATNQTIEG